MHAAQEFLQSYPYVGIVILVGVVVLIINLARTILQTVIALSIAGVLAVIYFLASGGDEAELDRMKHDGQTVIKEFHKESRDKLERKFEEEADVVKEKLIEDALANE